MVGYSEQRRVVHLVGLEQRETVTWTLGEGARMTEWDTHEACPDYIEVEDRRTANKNHEGADDVLDRTGFESVAGELRESVVPHFPRCCLAHVHLTDHGRPPWVGKDQQK